MRIISSQTIAGIVMGMAVTCGGAVAQEAGEQGGVLPFASFLSELKTASQSVAGDARASAAMSEMRTHLLRQYDGVHVKHSFAQDDQVFDCVPIAEQAGVRLQGLKTIASPPPTPPVKALAAQEAAGGKARSATQQPTAEATDRFGNAQKCDSGAVPVRRVTLDEVARAGSLQKFFEKGPNGAGLAPAARKGQAIPAAVNGHSYAHAYQYVSNYGGYSRLALYRPFVNGALSEIFSLSQQWYVGGSGSGLQTVEVGIQNYPAKYRSQNSALFIYWTRNGYNGTGCYNLDCAAFVQTNRNWRFGIGFSNYSTVGGTQYEVALGFYLYQGNWWLAAGNDWVGYYPGAIFAGGQLSRSAQLIDFGGETVGSWHWPAMGSGQFASAGWTRAAYQRSIVYRNAANTGFNPSLTKSQNWPSCQTISTPTWGGSDWKTYFYFGGPGGYGC